MTRSEEEIFVHPTADVSKAATIGSGTRIWNEAQVRQGAYIGRNCVVGKGVYVDVDVRIGERCKLENGANVFLGSVIEDAVFLGPGAQLLNDKTPRATTPSGELKGAADWTVIGVTVHKGASIGGGALLLPGVKVGRWAMVGAGSVVTRDVPDHAVVFGNPARVAGYVCRCGMRLVTTSTCSSCGTQNRVPGLEVSG